MKIVINVCYGGFGLSTKGITLYKQLCGIDSNTKIHDFDIDRDDVALVKIVETLGEESWDKSFAELKVVDIPDGIDWEIKDYDGWEHIAEVHRTWG